MPQTTRRKIRDQAKMSMDNMDQALGHLAAIDQLAQGRSPAVNDQLPQIVALVDQLRTILSQFRDKL